jgi:hypothetical protein
MRKILAISLTLASLLIIGFTATLAHSQPKMITTIVITGSGGIVPPSQP